MPVNLDTFETPPALVQDTQFSEPEYQLNPTHEQRPPTLNTHAKLSDVYPMKSTAKVYSSSNSSSTPRRQEVVIVEPSRWYNFTNPKFYWALSFILIILASLNFYWLSIACDVPADYDLNIELDHVIDQSNAQKQLLEINAL